MSGIDVDAELSALGDAVESDKHTAAERTFGGDKPAAPEKEGGNGFVKWMTNLPKNIGVGLIDAAVNSLDAVQPKSPDAAKEGAPVGTFTAGVYTPAQTPSEKRNGLMDDEHGEVVTAMLGLRNEMAQGSGTADKVTQSAAQFMLPFLGWSKLFSGIKAAQAAPALIKTAAKIGQAAVSESATMATAFDPHAGRLADLVEFGKHTESKFADALNVVAPDGSALNSYIDYMTDRGNESDAEGRFKNVIDGLSGSAVVASVLKVGAKAFRSARAFAESPVTLPEVAAPEHIAAQQAQKFADEAAMQFPESPHAAMVHLGEQADNALGDETVRSQYATAAEIARGKVSDKGIVIVPTDEGFTVVVGKQPSLTFLKEEDAAAAVADARRIMGGAFEKRAAAEHVKASDASFATLHAFSRVLKTNVDRPVSTHSLLSALERNLKGDTEQGAFYKELLGRLTKKKLGGTTTVSSKGGRTPDSAGHYASALNEIELYDRAFKSPKELIHTFAHEAVHAATFHELTFSSRVASQMERLRKVTQDVFEKQADEKTAATGARDARPYGFTNAHEFVAEIESNPEFRQLMQKTKLPEGGTAWDKYLETIAGILGVGGLVATPQGQKEFSKLMMGQKSDGENPRA